jgi:hypothetical protein
MSKTRIQWLFLCLVTLVLQHSVQSQIVIPGELTHEYVVDLGQVLDGEIEIVNPSDEPIGVSIRQSDYMFFADGTNIYGEPGAEERSNAGWITLALPSQLIIEPKDHAIVRYRVTVPEGPALVGTFWSMILVGPAPDPLSASESQGVSVRTILQYGIQIVTHIGDTGERQISIDAVQLLREETGITLQVDIGNLGERWIRPKAWVEIYDASGQLAGRFDSPQMRVYPGTSVRHRLLLDGIAPGTYSALVVFDNGDAFVWGAQYTLEI